MTSHMNTFGKQSDPRTALLLSLQGGLAQFASEAAALHAATEKHEEAQKRHEATKARVVGLEAKRLKLEADQASQAAAMQEQRLAALLEGKEPPKRVSRDAEVRQIADDIELVKGVLPGLEEAVQREHLAYSLTFQELRRAIHDRLNEALQEQAAKLGPLAGLVFRLRGERPWGAGPSPLEAGLSSRMSEGVGGAAPRGQQSDVAQYADQRSVPRGTTGVTIAFVPITEPDRQWLLDVAELARASTAEDPGLFRFDVGPGLDVGRLA